VRRWCRYLAGGLVGVGIGLCALDLAAPPPLERFNDRSLVVADRSSAPLRIFQSADDKWRLLTRPTDVDPLYLAMLKAYEDKRFDQHWGVDPLAIGRAAGQAIGAGQIVSGASTLTMQAVKLLSPRPRTLLAKAIEMGRAVQLESRLAKDDVLAIYLTLAPFGGPVEGVRAASLKLFGHEPSLLTPAEAALLIAIPQSPNARRPDRQPSQAKAARARVLDRVMKAGVITAEAAETAKNAPLPTGYANFPLHAPHFAEAQSATSDTAHTTLDGRLQKLAEVRLRAALQDHASPATASAMIVHAPTAEIRAIVGNPNYFDTKRAGMTDMTLPLRSPGSALKPFIYGLAFDRLVAAPGTLIHDRPWRSKGYAPTNFSGEWAGEVTIRDALTRSLNVPAVKVLGRIGPAQFDAALATAGINLTFDRERGDAGLALALGGVGVSMRDMARLYVGLASGGHVPDVLATTQGQAVNWVELLAPEAASQVLTILKEAPPPTGQTVTAAASRQSTSRIAFKTGTSYGYRDAWAAGVIGEYVVIAWVGRADAAPCAGCVGIGAAAPILFDLAELIETPGRMHHVPAIAKAPPPHRAHFDGAERRNISAGPPVRISFPVDGARMRLGRSGRAPLTALGGLPPYRWLTNGAPAGNSAPGRSLPWAPNGGGYHEVVVIDSAGAEASARVFIDAGS